MKAGQQPAEITAMSAEDLCLWSDQSMGWDDPEIVQEVDDVDKEIGAACALHWEYVRSSARREIAPHHGTFSLQRVRVRLSALHPCLRDVEFWTLDLRSTMLLFIVILVLVSFGAALFA